MAIPRDIVVMISSRNGSPINYQDQAQTFTDVRHALKQRIEEERLFEKPLFRVVINEEEPAGNAAEDVWDWSLREVREADIVLVLYNGDSGWPGKGNVGICHAELQEALRTAPGKVRIVQAVIPDDLPDERRHTRFQTYAAELRRFTNAEPAQTGEDVIEHALEALHEAVREMVLWGRREARLGRYASGDALDWSRLGFDERRRVMVETLLGALSERGGVPVDVKEDMPGRAIHIRLGGKQVLLVCHAIPDRMYVTQAREITGRTILRDYRWAVHLKEDAVGPVHLFACHKGLSETQAMALLGYPDATIVSPPFGIYIADNVRKIQIILLKNCRDVTMTWHDVQRVFDWLEQEDEDARLVQRAAARKRIVQTIAEEFEPPIR